MPHTGNFWIYDAQAVAAVNAAGLKLDALKNIETIDGRIIAQITDPIMAPLYANQHEVGPIMTLCRVDDPKFEIDKNGNITLVGKVDGVDVSGFKIVSVPPHDFVPLDDTLDYTCDDIDLRNRTTLTEQSFHAPVFLPHGATVTKLTLYGYRSTAGSILGLGLRRVAHPVAQENMAYVGADWTDGEGSGYDDTVDYAVIDNENYYYHLLLTIDPDASVDDCYFYNAKIEWS